LAQYNVAKFDYEMAEADKSFGSHNADYTRALLTEAETFFGIPSRLWRMLAGHKHVVPPNTNDQSEWESWLPITPSTDPSERNYL
jgi:hypothetical protein